MLKSLFLVGALTASLTLAIPPQQARADEIRVITSKSLNRFDGITGHSTIAWFYDDGRLRRTIHGGLGGFRVNDPTDVSMSKLQNCPDCNWRRRKVSGMRGSYIMTSIGSKYNRPYRSGIFLYTCSQFAMDIWRETTNGKEASGGWTPTDLNWNISHWNQWKPGSWHDSGKAWL